MDYLLRRNVRQEAQQPNLPIRLLQENVPIHGILGNRERGKCEGWEAEGAKREEWRAENVSLEEDIEEGEGGRGRG